MNLQWSKELQDCVADFQLYSHYAYVGFAEADGKVYVKIGYTNNVMKRMNNINGMSAIEIVHAIALGARGKNSAMMMESVFHTLLHAFRQHNEWFVFEVDNATHKAAIKDAIGAVQTMYGTQRFTFACAQLREYGRERMEAAFQNYKPLPPTRSPYRPRVNPWSQKPQRREMYEQDIAPKRAGRELADELERQRQEVLERLLQSGVRSDKVAEE